MAVLFATHDAELPGLFGIIFLQAGGEIFIDARVLFFERDGQREDSCSVRLSKVFINLCCSADCQSAVSPTE